jgi:hypothetical protein
MTSKNSVVFQDAIFAGLPSIPENATIVRRCIRARNAPCAWWAFTATRRASMSTGKTTRETAREQPFAAGLRSLVPGRGRLIFSRPKMLSLQWARTQAGSNTLAHHTVATWTIIFEGRNKNKQTPLHLLSSLFAPWSLPQCQTWAGPCKTTERRVPLPALGVVPSAGGHRVPRLHRHDVRYQPLEAG